MRWPFGLLVLLVAFAPAAARASADPQAIAVLGVEQRWMNAIAHRDARALGQILGDDFVHVNLLGRTSYRHDDLIAIAKPRRYTQKLSEQTVDFAGGTAIVRGINTISESGKVVLKLRYTDVYVSRANRCVAVSAQETPIDDPAARAKAARAAQAAAAATAASAAAAAADAAAAAAATDAPIQSPADGFGSHAWTLIEVSGMGVTQPDARSIQFDASSHHVSGSAGCNRFTGTYQSSGTSLEIGPLATTRMMCPPATMAAETTFLNALKAVRGFSFESGKLGLFDAGGTLVARFATEGPP